jgi:hypothetical protein
MLSKGLIRSSIPVANRQQAKLIATQLSRLADGAIIVKWACGGNTVGSLFCCSPFVQDSLFW